MREGGCAGLGRLKGTVYARMEEMSFRSGAAVARGSVTASSTHAPAELTMYA